MAGSWIQSITLAFKDSFTGGFKQATDAMKGMQEGMQEINNGSGLMSMARDLSVTASLTEPFREKLSAALNVPTQLSSGLNSTFTNIKTVTGSSAEEMKKLEEQIIGIGGKSTAGLQATTNAFYDIAGGVSDASVRMSTLQAAINMSEAGQADLGASTKGLISIVNAYGFSAEKTGFASDVFTRTVGMGVGTMDEFVGAMSPLAGLTASSGISFDELGGAMAFMTTQGTSAAMSATQIKASVTSLMNPNKAMSEAIKKAGYESGSTMLKELGLVESLQLLNTTMGGSQDAMAQALGSTEALQGAVALTKNGFGDFSATYKSGLAGITEASQKVQLESYEAKLKKLKSAQEEFHKEIGDSSIAIKGFGTDIQIAITTGINSLSKVPVLSWVPAVAGGAMTVGESILGMGGTALNVTAQMATLTATATKAGGFAKLFGNSFKLATAPIKTAGTAIVGFGKLAGGGILTGMKMLGSGVMTIGRSFIATLPAVWSFTASLLACPVTWIVLGIIALAAGVFLIIKNWSVIGPWLKGLWGKITGIFKAGWDFIWNGILNNEFVQVAMAIFLPFIGIPVLIIKNWKSIIGFFSGLPGFFGGVFVKAKDLALAGWNLLWNGILNNKFVQAALAYFFPFIGIPIMVIKNWKSITGFFTGLPGFFGGIFVKAKDLALAGWNLLWNGILNNKFVQAALAYFFPFIGIPILIIKNWKSIIGFFTSLPGICMGVGKSILNFLLMPVNGGIGLLNKLKIKVPAWVPPPFGGKEFGFNIPKIPSFSKGVRNFGGGLAYVHQDELVDLPRGANVYTRSETRSILGNKQANGSQGRSGDTYITMSFDSLIEKVGELENARDLLRIIGDLAGVAL